MLYFPLLLLFCYFVFFYYILWLFVGWSLFFVFVFMSLDSSMSNQESSLTCLLSFWFNIKLYHYYYGSFTSYYSILYYWIPLYQVTLPYYVMAIYLVLFLLFSFYFQFYSPISFTFTLVFVFLYLLSFLHYLSRVISWAKKCFIRLLFFKGTCFEFYLIAVLICYLYFTIYRGAQFLWNTVVVSFLAKLIVDCLELGKKWGLGCFRNMFSTMVCWCVFNSQGVLYY